MECIGICISLRLSWGSMLRCKIIMFGGRDGFGVSWRDGRMIEGRKLRSECKGCMYSGQ